MFECKACIRGQCNTHNKTYANLCREANGLSKAAVEGVDFKFNQFGHIVPITESTDGAVK